MAKAEPLGVWLHDRHVASITARRPWQLQCRYTADALDTWPGSAPVLSCSLPLQSKRMDASVFLAGLLPEGRQRQALSAQLGVTVNDIYSMLVRFGRDVAGALVIATEPPEPREPSVVPYTATGLEEEVQGLPDRPLAIHDDSELSLDGLQDKMVLVASPQGWGRPVHGYPSTHILKVDDPIRPGLVVAEADCMRLAKRCGLTTVSVSVEEVGERTCLIVSRFDRCELADGTVERVHQEDLCQALARNPDAAGGRGKYEKAGGPSLKEAADLLDRYAADPAAQLDRLLAVATFNVLIGNADAHGKNLALLHPTAETVELAPLYDTVPTVLWPKLRTTAAMSIAGRWELSAIASSDLVDEAASWRVSRQRATRVVRETAETARAAAEASDGSSGIAARVIARAETLLSGG